MQFTAHYLIRVPVSLWCTLHEDWRLLSHFEKRQRREEHAIRLIQFLSAPGLQAKVFLTDAAHDERYQIELIRAPWLYRLLCWWKAMRATNSTTIHFDPKLL